MTAGPATKPNFSDLGVRVASSVVLISIALFDFWKGGLYVTIMVMVGAALMVWEYRRIIVGKAMTLTDPVLLLMVAGALVIVLATGLHSLAAGGIAALAFAVAVWWLDKGPRWWMAGGLIYIALGMAVLVEMRRDPAGGFPLVMWLILLVIAVDAGGYFAGKLIGGPKLWPTVSPNKTWSGTLGGLALAIFVGAGFYLSGAVELPALLLVSGFIALAAQCGDLLESWLKRRYGVKDSSALIPGHGGLLDRFDGLVGALWAYALTDPYRFLAG